MEHHNQREPSERSNQRGQETGDHVAVDIVQSNEALVQETGDRIAVDIVQLNEALVSSIREKMEIMSPSLCIYRVPENIRKVNEKAYIPHEVSIGPFHHGKEDLKSMEEHKWLYLRALLSRKPNLEASLDGCVKAIRELEQRARKCYKGSIGLSSDEFVEMLIVDGCFVIELFFKYTAKSLRRRGDTIFSNQGKLFSLRRDMILLENQLPFFVLQCLFNIVPVPKQCQKPLIELAFRFFKIILIGDEEVLQGKFSQPGNHLLDFLRNCYLPSTRTVPLNPNVAERTIHSAEQLQKSGIKFKKKMTNSLLEIKFTNGVLKMPPINVHNYTDSLLRNLIALEQCSVDSTMYITSYAFFVGGLIHSPKDVQLLCQRGIITNYLSNDEEVSFLFEKLCEEVGVKDFYYAGLCNQVNTYGKTNCWESLKCHNLKSSQMNLLFMVALLVLLVIAIIGTLFSVLSFYLRHR